MKEQEKMLADELPKAGQFSAVTPQLLKLDSFRITSETVVPEEEFLMRMYGKPCLPRRDLTAVTGLEKCGKTFFTSMLMACCTKRQVLELERNREEPLRVMWYDTEQSRQSTKCILTDRIGKMVEDNDKLDDNLLIFNVRPCTYKERMEYLVTGIETYHPDLVIIDNVSDLLPSVNDADESQRVIAQLMELATMGNCNIVVVIHLNRSGDKRNLRGWLGTEILHKAFEVFYCEQVPRSELYSVEQLLTRKYRISDKLYYRITDDGLPEESDKPVILYDEENSLQVQRKSNLYITSKQVGSFNDEYIIKNMSNSEKPYDWDIKKLFTDAMSGCSCISPEMLREKVMKLSFIQVPQYYDKVFKAAEQQHIVTTTLDKAGRVVVITTPT
jgi:hypothetical protein